MTPAKKTSSNQSHGEVSRGTEPSGEADPFLVRALVRGLSILQLYDVDHREWTIDEMAEQTGLLRMTVYRMVRTLESLAFLVRDPVTGRYRLGPATLAMTYVESDNSELVDLARPFMESLLEATGESVTLAIEVDGIPVCVDILNTTRPFKRRTAPGRIIGDVTSVQGKLFAAFKPEAERKAILSRPIPKLTPHTITDPVALEAEFEQIRRENVAYDLEGLYFNTCAVGAPVRDQLGNVVASIAVVVPAGRFGPEERDRCTHAVKSTAEALSAYLGWNQVTSPAS
jgi:DNA-binding IclR family transcriptional regulator